LPHIITRFPLSRPNQLAQMVAPTFDRFAMKFRTFSLLALSLLLAGCASYAKRLEVPSVKKLQPQQSTRADVEKLFGRPKETVVGPNEVTIVRYFFHEFHKSTDASWHNRRDNPGEILFRTLTLAYNRSNIMERKLHDESVTQIYRTNAWFHAGPSLTPESISFVKRGVSTETDLRAKLGEPASRTFEDNGHIMLLWFNIKTRETTWSNPTVQRLKVVLDDRNVVQDYALVEHELAEFEPLTLH
jgi:hypothetical protein